LAHRYGEGGRTTRSVTLRGMTLDQRQGLADLLRTPSLPPASTTVTIARLAACYQLDEDGLRTLVETLVGSVGDRSAARSRARSARQQAAERLVAAARQAVRAQAHLDDRRLADWASRQARGEGTVLEERVAATEQALQVLATNAPQQPRALPVTAAAAFGDPHALDGDTVHGRLLDAALAAAADSDDLSAVARRRRRRAVGLLDDELSSTVLGWRLPLTGDGPSAQLGRLADRGGQPAVWTLAQLRADPPAARADVPVLVVENPSVLATAALERADTALLCTAGVPSVAAGALLDALAASGCPLLIHADFDPAGLRIVTGVLERHPLARPHLMDVETYREYVTASSVRWGPEDGEPVAGWDPELQRTMRQRGVSVFEEQMVARLIHAS
jgi:uncharacterized protein (TIGR02679 family)